MLNNILKTHSQLSLVQSSREVVYVFSLFSIQTSVVWREMNGRFQIIPVASKLIVSKIIILYKDLYSSNGEKVENNEIIVTC